MAYIPIPPRTTLDPNASADINQLNDNVVFVKAIADQNTSDIAQNVIDIAQNTSDIADGWSNILVGLTYASASTITTASDLTSILSAGMKLKITQTTVKYFDIISVTSNTIVVDAGTTYTVANAAITSPAYSTAENPHGWDNVWWAYTPTVTAASGTITSYTATGSYKRFGKTVHGQLFVDITDAGTGTGKLNSPLPYGSANNTHTGAGRENSLTGKQLQGIIITGSIGIYVYDNSSVIATGAQLLVSFIYEQV